MTFLNPIVLFGLAAAAIPIVIHLLNLRKLKTVEFSTLRFLKELQRTSIRRLKIRQWLLLLLRTLLVVFLVLAFSRPAIRGSLAGLGSTEASTGMVIVLDDSPSMGIRNERGVVFDQAKNLAERIVDFARPGDAVSVLRLSEANAPVHQDRPLSAEAARKALQGMTVTGKAFPYGKIIAAARRLAASSQHANRELYLFTDAQRLQFTPDPEAIDTAFTDDERLRVYLVEIPSPRRENAAVTSVTLESRLLAPQVPIIMKAVVRNAGDHAIGNAVGSLYLDGTRVAQQSFSVAAGGAATLQFTAVPASRGIVTGAVQIEDDVLEIDNRRAFVINIPTNIRVLLVGSSIRDTRYPFVALTLGGDSSLAKLFTVERIMQDRLAQTHIGQYDVVLLANPGAIPAREGSRLAAAVKSGVGLVLFPGRSTVAASINTSLLAAANIPPFTAAPAPANPSPQSLVGFLTFGAVDFSHPLFAGMFTRQAGRQSTPPSLDGPRITAAAGLNPGRSGQTVIAMSDGRPFLCDYTIGNGHVLAFAVDADTMMSDFPFKGLFAPLLHRSVMYLAGQQQAEDTCTVGQRLILPVRLQPSDLDHAAIVRHPSGVEERVTVTARGDQRSAVIELGDTPEPGVYRAFAGPAERASGKRRLLQAAAVHPAPLESDLHRAGDQDLEEFWARHRIAPGRVTRLGAADDIDRVVRESRYGFELWRLFVVLAIACALGEMLLARAIPVRMEDMVGTRSARDTTT
jgi:hypothetical protein